MPAIDDTPPLSGFTLAQHATLRACPGEAVERTLTVRRSHRVERRTGR